VRDTLIRVDEETWVNPTQVAAVVEERYGNTPETTAWLIRVTLKGSGRIVSLSGTRAAQVAALLTGEELR
jgi:N-methylhydantoinase B/oxoprolinase/acetone carboxylase alpha subunit